MKNNGVRIGQGPRAGITWGCHSGVRGTDRPRRGVELRAGLVGGCRSGVRGTCSAGGCRSGLVSVLYGSYFHPSPSPAGSLSQPPGFTLAVPQSVSVQEGLCVFIPCNFTYPASYDTDNPSAQLYGQWYKEPATAGQDPPVASSVPSVKVSQETQGRFRLTGDPALGDCSLQISDARRTDAGRYFLNIEKGMLDHTYRSNSDGTAPALRISVPGTLLAGHPVTMTCTAPGRCSGSPPQITWTGPFINTARNVSAQLANGTWAHSSELSFTPDLGDNGKELVCTVTYSSAQEPSTSRTIWLHVVCDLVQRHSQQQRSSPGDLAHGVLPSS
uniref:Ig-like domain-containing protein n=1 Tax=Chrysemys picta bellii TaxID=8478 RepID=A0A8C3HS83_CHRPI